MLLLVFFTYTKNSDQVSGGFVFLSLNERGKNGCRTVINLSNQLSNLYPAC